MSARVCYIQREDRGAILSSLRLIGRTTDDSWKAPSDGFAIGAASSAASWIGERLEGRLGGRHLERLCLDVDGSVCSWVPASSTEANMLKAVIERDSADDGDSFSDQSESGAGRFPDLPNEVGYQVLGVATAPKSKSRTAEGRATVLAVPEVAARAVVDALDEASVQIGSCITLWQAMASAWAPRTGSVSTERVVADSVPLTAAVLCIPGDRIVWAWIQGGVPVAAGAFRTRVGSKAATADLLLGDTDGEASADDQAQTNNNGDHLGPNEGTRLGGRLAAEWLAWGAQLGAFPGRVTWIGPVHSVAGATGDPGAIVGIEPADIATAVRTAAPDATVDVIDDEDPVGLTLRRLAERLDDEPRAVSGTDTQLQSLSNRPGRVHRAMYHWLAIMLLFASGAIGVFAWWFWQERGRSMDELASVRANQRELLEQGAPELVDDRLATVNLRDRVNAQRGPAPIDNIPKPKPVLRELETLAFVLGNPDYELEEIDITSFSVSFRVRVEDTRAYEQLQDSLRNIAGSSVNWNSFNPRPNRDKITINGTGTWLGRAAGGDS